MRTKAHFRTCDSGVERISVATKTTERPARMNHSRMMPLSMVVVLHTSALSKAMRAPPLQLRNRNLEAAGWCEMSGLCANTHINATTKSQTQTDLQRLVRWP